MTIAEQLIEEGRQRGREEARKQAWQQGWRQGWIKTLRHLLVFKFQLQALDPSYEARMQTAALEALDRYPVRVLTADSLAAVFAD